MTNRCLCYAQPNRIIPRKFYGSAKVDKLSITDTELPLCPIIESKHCYVSARYLAKTLSPPSRSQYTLESSKTMKNKKKETT